MVKELHPSLRAGSVWPDLPRELALGLGAGLGLMLALGAWLLNGASAEAQVGAVGEGCRIAGSLRLQGRVGHGGTRVEAGAGKQALTGVGGSFAIEGVPGGSLRLRASHSGFVSAEASALDCSPGAELRMAQLELAAGDTNADDKVNLLDLVRVGAGFGTCQGEAGHAREADLNLDGCTDLFDLVLVGANYGLEGPSDWPLASGAFQTQVMPIFERYCRGCHGDQGGLNLDGHAGVMAGGRSGPAVLPGDPEGSLLYRRISGAQPPWMPPGGQRLSPAELEVIRAWIESGAGPD